MNGPKKREAYSTADILTFFSKNFVYPKEQQDNFQGSIYISFIVDTDGQLKNIDVDKKYFGGNYSPVELEAIRVFKLMPAWTPGQCNSLTVPVKMKIPIKF
ncbi:MAG: energy transducer TonB [Bacteroidia bacterium]|nr:energy transducer TonB [Bacteroidia bacterium]